MSIFQRVCDPRVAALVLCVVWGAGRSDAQTTGATLSGRVVDQTNLPLPAATVTATAPATGYTRSVPTAADGTYTIPSLPVGTYDIAASLNGFRTMEQKQVELEVASTRRIDFTLPVASVQAEISVTAAPPIVQIGRRGRNRRQPARAREPAAERPAVRQSRRARARHLARLQLGPHQARTARHRLERRQRPQRQLHRRRRRQHRRHDRRRAAEFLGRERRAVQDPDAELQGRVRPVLGRRRHRRHQERHEPAGRKRIRVRPQREPERDHRDRGTVGRRQERLRARPVRRGGRRTDRPRQGALLRQLRGDAPQHQLHRLDRRGAAAGRHGRSPCRSAIIWSAPR